MKIIKKNQLIIYVLVLILMIAGYLNYTGDTKKQLSLETAMQLEQNDGNEVSDIGDAKLVNSQDVTSENNLASDNTSQSNETDKESKTNTVENDTIQTNSNEESSDYFVKSRLERDNMYSQMIESYENVLNSSNSIETQRQSATQEIEKINNTKNSIMICENLIKTKGFENSVIFVNGQSINVIIGAEELKQEQIAQVQNIISREMQAEIGNIHITNK